MARYEEFEHTADVGIRVWGETPEELFAVTARAMTGIMAGDRRIQPIDEMEIRVEGESPEELLVAFLSELLFLVDVKNMLFCEFRPVFEANALWVHCRGEELTARDRGLGSEIKAVTRHQLVVDLQQGYAQVLFDV